MKTLLPALLVAFVAGGGAWYATTEPQQVQPIVQQKHEPAAQLPPIATPHVGPGLQLLQPGNPPAPLPQTVNCTVVVNGSATGTFPLTWDGVGWAGTVTVPGAGTRPVFLQMGMVGYPTYPVPTLVAHVSPFGEATHNPSSAHYCSFGPAVPLNIRADVTASTRPTPHVANTVVFVFQG